MNKKKKRGKGVCNKKDEMERMFFECLVFIDIVMFTLLNRMRQV